MIGVSSLFVGCILLIIGLCFDDKRRWRLSRGAVFFIVGICLVHLSIWLLPR